MRRRAADREHAEGLIEGLESFADSLRSGASLRHAIAAFAGDPGSPFHTVAAELAAGAPLVPTLHAGAASPDLELAAVCCVLAVHAEAGGDPLPACNALAERVAARQASQDEAQALTTQARLGARTMLLLTPGFLLLVAASDPKGAIHWLADPGIRLAVMSGLLLQLFGAWWIGAIIANAGGSASTMARIPVLRALRAIVAGRGRRNDDEDVAACADVVALVLDSGLSPTAAVCVASPYAHGPFGEALRTAISQVETPLSEALAAASLPPGSDAAVRFVRSVTAATDLGVPLAPALRSLADDIRRRADVRVATDIRRASVRVLLPLGILVLPAFVLACLVPLFVGGLDGIAG